MGWIRHDGRRPPARPSQGSFIRADGLAIDTQVGNSSSFVVGTIEIGDYGRFPVRLRCADEAGVFGRENLQAINERLDETVSDAVALVEQLRADYGHQSDPIPKSASMDFSVPNDFIAEGANWTIWFHEDIAGWMIELEGWEVIGRQGVF